MRSIRTVRYKVEEHYNQNALPYGGSDSIVLVPPTRDAHPHEPNPVLPEAFIPYLLGRHKQMPDTGLSTRYSTEANSGHVQMQHKQSKTLVWMKARC